MGEREANAARRKGGGKAGALRRLCGARPRPFAEIAGVTPGRGWTAAADVAPGAAQGWGPDRDPPADQPEPVCGGASGALSVRPLRLSPEPSSGVSVRAPGVWPCARPCALARPRRERLHGCCVGRPAALDAVGWGNTVASFPAGGGPVRGAGHASRTVCGAGAGRAAGAGPRMTEESFPGSGRACRRPERSSEQTGANRRKNNRCVPADRFPCLLKLA